MYNAYVGVSNGTIYCTGTTHNKDNQNDVYSYDTSSNQWKQLPRPGHRLGVLYVVDNKLTIFGGRDSTTNNIHNKVTTYNSKENRWYSYYPNMLLDRVSAGVITYHDHVIVMGGTSSTIDLDSIEVMNYHRRLQWKKVPVRLPVPMWGIKPTVSGDDLVIVGYSGDLRYTKFYQTKVNAIINLYQPLPTDALTKQWKERLPATHNDTVTVPFSSPPVIIGGNMKGIYTSDVSLYDTSKHSWRKVDSLTSARDCVGVALLNNNVIIVIGGSNGGVDIKGAMASSLTTVEIGNIVPNQ